MKTNTTPSVASKAKKRAPTKGRTASADETTMTGIQTPAASNPIPLGAESHGEEKAAYLLRQVAERLANSLTQALRPFKQTTGVYRVLIALTRRNPATMRELIDLTLIESSTLSRTVARMEEQGLLKCSPVEGDGRALLITLTQAGQAQLDAILPAASAQYDWAVHNIPPEDLEVMRLTLQKMLRNLKISPIK